MFGTFTQSTGVVTNLGDENVQERVAGEVKEFLQAHPLYPEL